MEALSAAKLLAAVTIKKKLTGPRIWHVRLVDFKYYQASVLIVAFNTCYLRPGETFLILN
jgi:hypothetical protein